jgi:hypothetical protein
VLAADGAAFAAALGALHPGLRGRPAAVVTLCKTAARLRTLCSPAFAALPPLRLTHGDKRRPADDSQRSAALGVSPSALWSHEALAARFTHKEVELLWARFEPLEALLRGGAGGAALFVPGFQSGPAEYHFERAPGLATDADVAGWVRGWALSPRL